MSNVNSSDEPFHPRDPPFRGTPNLTTRSQRLHHVAPVLSEPRQSSRLSRSFFFSSSLVSPPARLSPTISSTRGGNRGGSSIVLLSEPYFQIDFRLIFQNVLFEELIKRGIEINDDRIEFWSFNFFDFQEFLKMIEMFILFKHSTIKQYSKLVF